MTTNKLGYRPDQDEMDIYLREGEARAMSLGNRGPVRYDEDGNLHPEILDAYWRCGFYVFEGVVGQEELNDIEADLKDILDRLPSEKGSPVDAKGRPALTVDCTAPTLFWSKPLADPFGGTELATGAIPSRWSSPPPMRTRPRKSSI